MAYQPTYPSPYMDSIDVSQPEGNIFKCLINPKDIVTMAVIKIYNNATNTLIKTVKLPSSLFPFYGSHSDDSWLQYVIDNEGLSNGADYKWTIDLIFSEQRIIATGTVKDVSVDAISGTSVYIDCDASAFKEIIDAWNKEKEYETWNAGVDISFFLKFGDNLVRISKVSSTNGYVLLNSTSIKLNVGDYYEIHGFGNFIVSPEYFFKARTKPTVELAIPETISSSSYSFNAKYTQNEGVKVCYYEYKLYSGGELIATSGQIYSQKIEHTFDEFISGNDYFMTLEVVNDEGVTIKQEYNFSVSYEFNRSIITPAIETNDKKTCININFENTALIPSTLVNKEVVNFKIFDNSNYEYVTNGTIISYSYPYIEVAYYKNLKPKMYIKINETFVKILQVDKTENKTMNLTLENEIPFMVPDNTPYEIYSLYNGIQLESGQEIYWDKIGNNPLLIPDNSTQILRWHPKRGFCGDVFEGINYESSLDRFKISYNGQFFNYNIGTTYSSTYDPHKGVASAIAGADEHSICTSLLESYSIGDSSVVLENNSFITVGKTIQLGNEHRIITNVINGDNMTISINLPFSNNFKETSSCVIYDENYLYLLTPDDELQDTDILIDNDLASEYWWLFVVLPEEIKIIKTDRFIESEVTCIAV